MAQTHSEIITETAANLASLTNEAILKITNDILSSAAKELLKHLGDEIYDEYVEMFGDEELDRNVPFHELNKDQRWMKKLETAEAYLVLYYLAPALKELEETVAISPKQTFGTGAIFGSPVRDIMLLREKYYNEAISIIHQVTLTSGFFITGSVLDENNS